MTRSRKVVRDLTKWVRVLFDEEHQIALELESKLQFMTERCKGLEKQLDDAQEAIVVWKDIRWRA